MKPTTRPSDLSSTQLQGLLHPQHSRLRPHLALFALRNQRLLQAGQRPNNNPSISWYHAQLTQFGVSQNYWGIRRQLIRLAQCGLLTEKAAQRPVAVTTPYSRRLTQAYFREFYLKASQVPPLLTVLTRCFDFLPSDLLSEAGTQQAVHSFHAFPPQPSQPANKGDFRPSSRG